METTCEINLGSLTGSGVDVSVVSSSVVGPAMYPRIHPRPPANLYYVVGPVSAEQLRRL